MARPKAKAPARRYHLSGQSVVTIDGRDFYLGTHDSPEALARYAVLIAAYQAGGLSLPSDFDLRCLDPQVASMCRPIESAPQQQTREPIRVQHVTALFRLHVAEKYANSRKELNRHNKLCDELDAEYAELLVSEFGPVRLKEYRDKLVKRGLARKYVNRIVNCVISVFRYGVSVELVDVATVDRLRTLEPLRFGQTSAPEKQATKPANIEHVRATAKHLSPVIKAMVRVQVATGMRPIELFRMRPCDIDRSGKVWIYSPQTHKTMRTGREKLIPIIGDARDAITDYLNRDPDTYLFSPAESMQWHRAQATAKRVTPAKQGNRVGTNRTAQPKRQPQTMFAGTSYQQAIKRAAKKAGVPHWYPYQLRHLTATVIRSALGIEESQALLGHSTALMTAHYARESVEAATRAAKAAPKL